MCKTNKLYLFTVRASTAPATSVIEIFKDRFTSWNMSCLFGNWFHIPKSHISFSCLIRKMLQVPHSNSIISGNKVEFNTFFVAWSTISCCGPSFLEVASQNSQAARPGRPFTAHVEFSCLGRGSSIFSSTSTGYNTCIHPGQRISSSVVFTKMSDRLIR